MRKKVREETKIGRIRREERKREHFVHFGTYEYYMCLNP